MVNRTSYFFFYSKSQGTTIMKGEALCSKGISNHRCLGELEGEIKAVFSASSHSMNKGKERFGTNAQPINY
jgi:hypothetical protein